MHEAATAGTGHPKVDPHYAVGMRRSAATRAVALRGRPPVRHEALKRPGTTPDNGADSRRSLEPAFDRTSNVAARTVKPLSLPQADTDADRLERWNGHYGHAAGNEVLKGLARCFPASVDGPNDFVASIIGSEEFAALRPNTGEHRAMRVAQAVHPAVATLAVPLEGIEPRTVTVSIKLAVEVGVGSGPGSHYRRADAALYEAKTGARDQTRRAAPAKVRAGRGRAAA